MITINFVLVPTLLKLEKGSRWTFIRRVFPGIFSLASFLSLTAVISGLAMSYMATDWQDLVGFASIRWGFGIFSGAVLGILLTFFHFFVESRLKPISQPLDNDLEVDVERISKVLKIVPRIWMPVLVAIVLLMMFGARGL